MLTYSLQWLIALLCALFAALALRIGRSDVSPNPYFRGAWRLAGITFCIDAACQVVQYVWGGIALRGGVGSPAMTSYLEWAPALNHSRTFLALALSLALVVLAVRRAPPGRGFFQVYMATVTAMFLLGFAVGAVEGTLIEARHYLRVALWDTVELFVVLGSLFVILLADRVDRFLWGALATNGFSVALSIIWLAALSRITDPLSWSPAPWQIATYRAVLASGMVALAAYRLTLARRGVRVGGLIGSDARHIPTLSG